MKIEIDQEELKNFVITLMNYGEENGYSPEKFAVLLAMASKHISDSVGVQVGSYKKGEH